LCRANGGHLVRIVGPAFELVSGWHTRGIPFKIVCKGIDRRLGRQPEQQGRRRPLRIEFCKADVLDVFDEWRRAVGGLTAAAAGAGGDAPEPESPRGRGPSLPAHLQRAQIRLTSVLSGSRLPPALTAFIDDVVGRLDAWRADATSLRGERRRQVLAGLQEIDHALMACAWASQDAATIAALHDEATRDLAAFRGRMTADQWDTTVQAAATRLLRERLLLPSLSLDP
jgi:hypothetical protein